MSYNTEETAKAITGVDITQESIDAARSIIDQYTDYRWETTTVSSKKFSGVGGEYWLCISSPIISITSLVMDDTTLTVTDDYELRTEPGMIKILNGITIGNDNVVLSYTYGFDSDHFAYKAVLTAEAELALYLQKNPTIADQVKWGSVSLMYGDAHVCALLLPVPRKMAFGAI